MVRIKNLGRKIRSFVFEVKSCFFEFLKQLTTPVYPPFGDEYFSPGDKVAVEGCQFLGINSGGKFRICYWNKHALPGETSVIENPVEYHEICKLLNKFSSSRSPVLTVEKYHPEGKEENWHSCYQILDYNLKADFIVPACLLKKVGQSKQD